MLSATTWHDLSPPPPPAPAGIPDSAADMITDGLDGYFSLDWRRPMISFWTSQANRRAAAALVAIRLYQADHDGANPPSLEALVPEYLSAVPVDPFSPDGGPLRYLANAEGPVVYSVGFDGIDGGGDWRREPSPVYSRDNWGFMDVPFPLPWPADWLVFSPLLPPGENSPGEAEDD